MLERFLNALRCIETHLRCVHYNFAQTYYDGFAEKTFPLFNLFFTRDAENYFRSFYLFFLNRHLKEFDLYFKDQKRSFDQIQLQLISVCSFRCREEPRKFETGKLYHHTVGALKKCDASPSRESERLN